MSEQTARAGELNVSLCAVLLSEACNTGVEPLAISDVKALKRDRLLWVAQNYLRDATLLSANTTLVAAQNALALAHQWGGGEVASADGMRFVVPVKTIHAAPNPKYFGVGRGVTYYNLVSDQFAGLNAITVPGTLRDSLVLLSVVLKQETELQPTQIMTDTGSYSDVVFGLFRLLHFRFSPRLADIGGARLWRMDSGADYGALNGLARQKIKTELICAHWDDLLRLAGSLRLGKVSPSAIIRTLQIGDRPTRLAQALAEFGRIDKTLHILNYINDEDQRRATLTHESRRKPTCARTRTISWAAGRIASALSRRTGGAISALGLVTNVIILWNTIYIEAALSQLRNEGFAVLDADVARLSPLIHEHINMLGRYSFVVPEAVTRGELRQLRDPKDDP